jgi:Ca-activated chloride channel family protein
MRITSAHRKLAAWAPAVALVVVAVAATACGRAEPLANSRGNEAFAEQDYDGALLEYQAAQAENPERPELFYNSASAHYRNEDYLEARADIEQALLNADERLTQSGVYNQGNAYFQSEDLGNAIESYKEALRLDPDDLDAKYNLELALQQLEEQEEEGDTPEEEGQGPGGDQEQESDQDDQPGDDQENGDQEGEGDQPSPDEGQQPGDDEGDEGDEEEQDAPAAEPSGQPELNELQAMRLLDSVGQNTETLQGRLQRIFVSPGRPPEQDW